MAKNIRIIPLDGDITFSGTTGTTQVLDIQYGTESNDLTFQNGVGIPLLVNPEYALKTNKKYRVVNESGEVTSQVNMKGTVIINSSGVWQGTNATEKGNSGSTGPTGPTNTDQEKG